MKKETVKTADKRAEVDILLKFCQEEWEQRRQSENQRSVMTNFILTIASAITVLIINNGLALNNLPLSILLIFLGVFGAIAVAKLYERGEYHIESTKVWRQRIDELYPDAELLTRRRQADKAHATKFGKTIRERIRLHGLWINFNIAIAVLGIGLTALILFINI